MKKIVCLIILALLLFPSSDLAVHASQNMTVEVILNETNLYVSADIHSITLCTVPFRAKLEVLDTIQNQYTFYRVEYNSHEGFIFAGHTMDIAYQSPKQILHYNGKIKNDNSKVYMLVGDEYSQIEGFSLAKETEIRILDGYNSKKEYCTISFYYEDNVYTFLIKTEDIAPYGVGKNLVVAISLLITCVSLILILFGFSFKNKKKSDKNN